MTTDAVPPPRMADFTNEWFERYRAQGVTAVAGHYTYGRPEIQFRPADLAAARVEIGSFTAIGRGCTINIGSFGRHPIDFVSSYPLAMIFGAPPAGRDHSVHETPAASVSIGSDVWIGEGCLIQAGVTIGNGAVVGARSLVNHDVPSYGIVAGTPARLIRYRFDEATIAALLKLAWWTWPDETIRANLDCFFSRDVARAVRMMHDRTHT